MKTRMQVERERERGGLLLSGHRRERSFVGPGALAYVRGCRACKCDPRLAERAPGSSERGDAEIGRRVFPRTDVNRAVLRIGKKRVGSRVQKLLRDVLDHRCREGRVVVSQGG
jgi:hypothetical protein